MAHLLFIPNAHILVWLPVPLARPSAWIEQVRRGEWQPPEEVTRSFDIPQGARFQAVVHGDLVVIHPDPALEEKAAAKPFALNTEQRRILELAGKGWTTDQIARAIGRRRRYVYYQFAALKRAFGAATRAELTQKKRAKPPVKRSE